MNGRGLRYILALDQAQKRRTLHKLENATWQSELTVERPQPDVILLNGQMDGRKIQAKLRAKPRETYLSSSGFHWINEYPFNLWRKPRRLRSPSVFSWQLIARRGVTFLPKTRRFAGHSNRKPLLKAAHFKLGRSAGVSDPANRQSTMTAELRSAFLPRYSSGKLTHPYSPQMAPDHPPRVYYAENKQISAY